MIDHNYIAADVSRNYMVPMSKKNEDIHIEYLVKPEVTEDTKGNILIIRKDGYRTKFINKTYFSWLIYQDYIKVLNN